MPGCCRVLIERFSFRTTFVVTAGVKLLGWLPLLPVPWILGDDFCRCSRSHKVPGLEEAEEPFLSAEQRGQEQGQGCSGAAGEPGTLTAATTVPNAVAADVQPSQAKQTSS